MSVTPTVSAPSATSATTAPAGSTSSQVLAKLQEMRAATGERRTRGLTDAQIARFAGSDPALAQAVDEALSQHLALQATDAALLALPEAELCARLQQGYVNFYSPPTVNPYVALAAKGPWIITTHGAVIHDNGGYGMLGQGHNPDDVLAAMSEPQVMANVMTPNFAQLALDGALRRELGHSRPDGCPFARFICMNSGSESVTVAARLSDVNALRQTAPGGKYAGKPVKIVAMEGAFHGRTDRPSQFSHSCLGTYKENLRSFKDLDNLELVFMNDHDALRAVFQRAQDEGFFIEAVVLEPVQGEGAPGRKVKRSFYDLARQLTLEHDALLIVDSVQAGIRGQGTLSIVDYPGFQDAAAPDVETWSKALNAGQYPLSVLGMTQRAADLYVTGIYGNTMTTNPRALRVAVAVLDAMTPELRANIMDRGAEFVEMLERLQGDYPWLITEVEGAGLLCCAELDPRVKVVGFDWVEERCRLAGLGVIHGGKNALRFTPHFNLGSDEIALIEEILREVFDGLDRPA